MANHEARELCIGRFCAADFFKDSPWLQVPLDKQAEILVQPLYPSGRLLGGASGKPSKLAQLAAARRKKEEEGKSSRKSAQESSTQQDAGYVDILGKLDRPARPDDTSLGGINAPAQPFRRLPKDRQDVQDKSLQSPNQHSIRTQRGSKELDLGSTRDEAKSSQSNTWDLQASPSEFATAMLGTIQRSQIEMTSTSLDKGTFSLPLISQRDIAEPFSFADPSPDDIVSAAQNSRGAWL